MKRVGILELQGSFIEHEKMLKKLQDVEIIKVKNKDDLNRIDGLILPGGESSAIANLLHKTKMMNPLRDKIKKGLPVWGTCAGMILLAKEIENETSHLNVMNIKVKRNAFGRQISSFKINKMVPMISEHPLELIFIRAPWIETANKNVQILCEIDHKIVAAKQNNMLVTSFHPELTNDITVHQYFVENMIKKE